MARVIRASASSALMVHSEKGLVSRKLDEGRMAHPPLGCPLPCEPNYGRLKIVPSKSRIPILLNPLPNWFIDLLPVAESLPRWERPPELPRAAFFTSTLGYPARGPASWRRRSECSSITDSAGVGFTESPSSHVQCNIPDPGSIPRIQEPKFPNGCCQYCCCQCLRGRLGGAARP